MAKVKSAKAKLIKSSDGNTLAIVNPDAAGIDIADTEMQGMPSANCVLYL